MTERHWSTKALTVVLVLLLAGYLLFTPTGALRLALALEGHPLAALTVQAEERPHALHHHADARLYYLEKGPWHSGEHLREWTVKKYGALYLGQPGMHG